MLNYITTFLRSSAICVFNILATMWVMTAANPMRPPQSSGSFWHVTDFHWDGNYTAMGGDVNNMCWLTNNSDPNVDIGYFGNYACDSPWELVKSTLNFMKKERGNPDLVIWTGDDSSHANDSFFSLDKVIDIMGVITNAINETFPNTPVIPVFGNHDCYPKHDFPARESEIYIRVAKLWQSWLKDGYTTFQKGGYYNISHPTLKNVVILGLNTPLYYQKNDRVASFNNDPAGQFAWMDAVLTDAAANNKKAYIAAHVSPGIFGRKVTPEGYQWFRPKYNEIYLSLIQKHADTIIGQFYGHDHTDSFKLYYNSQGVPVNAHFVAPAVTPWNTTLSGIGPNNPGARLYSYQRGTGKDIGDDDNNNGTQEMRGNQPAVRLFAYDTTNGNVLDYQQFYLNLTQANSLNRDQWQLEYSFLQAYDLPNMSYQEIDRMVQTFTTSNRSYFDKYYLYNSVSSTGPEECDAVCERNHYCSITEVSYYKFAICNNAPSTNIGKSGVTLLTLSVTACFAWLKMTH